MRIEQLTLYNINALQGKWTIDFTVPDFADSGIFAITGPTGAGKSTILDAICLALYGQTPRLGKITTGSNALMSRHRGECSAEVVLRVDGRRYRVFWGQKRARGKADGKLQAARHELADADSGQLLEARLSRTPQQVAALTGLDFERFVRAVMLAQGQFAAFLHASGDERAPILEQITGTAIYSRLSMATHARYSEENHKLQSLHGSLAHLQLPDDEAVAALAQRLAQANRDVAAAKQALDASSALYAQSQALQQQRELCTRLDMQYQDALAALAALAPKQEALDRHQQALPGIILHQNEQRESREQQALAEQLQQGQHRLHQLQQALERGAQTLAHHNNAWQQAVAAEQSAQTVVQQARELDALYRQQQQQAQTWQSEREELAFAAAETMHALAAQAQEGDTLEAAYRQALDGKDMNAWQEALESARERFAALRAIHQLHAQQSAMQEAIQAHGETLAQRQHSLQQCQHAEEQAQQALMAAEHSAADKRRLYEQARLIRSLSEHRAHLKEGEPCPLCGATAHPYRNAAALTDDDHEAWQAAERAYKAAQHTQQHAQNARLEAAHALSHALEHERQQQAALATLREELRPRLQAVSLSATELEDALSASQQEGQAIRTRLDLLYQLQGQRERLQQISRARQWQSVDAKLDALKRQMADNRNARKALLAAPDADAYALQLRTQIQQALQRRDKAQQAQAQADAACQAQEAKNRTLHDMHTARSAACNEARAAFNAFLARSGFDTPQAWQAALLNDATAQQWQEAVTAARRHVEQSHARLAAEQDNLARLHAALPDDLPDPATLNAKRAAQDKHYAAQLQIQGQLLAEQDEQKRLQALFAERQQDIAAQQQECEWWRQLHDLIGSADGKKFRNFAQGLTFDMMIAHANCELAKMSDRYLLVRADSGHLELDVSDDYLGGEIRTTKNLSGGEQFIVSLALALGLSKMAGENIRIDSLFLDEGFGTLDEQALDQALDTLASLPQQGKLIGIISHVSALRERIASQIRVVPQSGGISILRGSGVSKS